MCRTCAIFIAENITFSVRISTLATKKKHKITIVIYCTNLLDNLNLNHWCQADVLNDLDIEKMHVNRGILVGWNKVPKNFVSIYVFKVYNVAVYFNYKKLYLVFKLWFKLS